MATMTAEPISIQVKRGGKYPCVSTATKEVETYLVPFGCLHVGADTFQEELLDKTIGWVLANKAFWIGTGDWMENATKFSPGDGVYRQKMSPDEQIEYLIDKFRPISDQCIGCIRGNHEERTIKTTGIDPLAVICRELKIPYLGCELFANITMGPDKSTRSFSVYAVHSTMASKTEGLEMNVIERDMEKFTNFDIIIKGHGHKAALSGPYLYLEYDKYANAVKESRRWFLLTGSFLGDRPNTYAAQRPMRPRIPGTIALDLRIAREDNERTKEVRQIDLRYL